MANNSTDSTDYLNAPVGSDLVPVPVESRDAIDAGAQWTYTREALTAIGKALEHLTPEMRSRVLSASAILTGCEQQVVRNLTRFFKS